LPEKKFSGKFAFWGSWQKMSLITEDRWATSLVPVIMYYVSLVVMVGMVFLVKPTPMLAAPVPAVIDVDYQFLAPQLERAVETGMVLAEAQGDSEPDDPASIGALLQVLDLEPLPSPQARGPEPR
jgi:hypothetical protein